MKNKIPLTILLILFLIGCNSPKEKQLDKKINTELSEKLQEYFETLKNLKKFNGVVLLQQNGEQIHFDSYNMQEVDSSLKVSKSSQFDIHSISKLMAKAVFVDLEMEGTLSQNDNISKYIKDFPNGDKITIKHLLDNQSGLPRNLSNEPPNLIDKSPEELIELIKREKLLFEPGTETMYSNIGYQVLYYIISKAVNVPFVQLLDQKLFKLLKMESTGAHFHLSKDNLNELVKNHELDDGEIVVVPNIQNDSKNQAKIYSTVQDLLSFIEHAKKEPYLSKIKNKRDVVGWSGGGDGILSHVEYNIKGDYEFVFFSNYDEIPFGDILNTVDNIMTNRPYDLPQKIDRKSIEISEETLIKYEGKYRVREFNNSIFEFKVEDGKLVLYQDGERGGILSGETNTTFFGSPTDEDYFEFRQNQNTDYTLIFHYKKIELEGKRENGM